MDAELRIAELERELSSLKVQVEELQGRCPCLVSKLMLRRDRPTELEVELRKIADRRREHEQHS